MIEIFATEILTDLTAGADLTDSMGLTAIDSAAGAGAAAEYAESSEAASAAADADAAAAKEKE